MILIPGGTFQMGRNDGAEDGSEGPAHSVDVASFMMEKSEVNNGEYSDFVRKTDRPWPAHWTTPRSPPGEEMRPVENVSYEDAIAFASWRSRRDNVTYRLPTEEEWEYAARNGARSDLYPWGNEWKDYAVVNQREPSAVGSRPEGKNIWGVEDLLGNVWEWTSSKNKAYPGSRQTIPTNRKDWYIFRGGGIDWHSGKGVPLTSCLRSAEAPTLKGRQLGFRLVTSAP
jgi:formylglycine-generating enzyme required for sulfatase activity